MLKIALSPAALGLRALIARAGVAREKVLLTDWCSVDWQSLTFIGERHHISLRICGPDADDAAARLTAGIEDAEFAITGQLVADITVIGGLERAADGSIVLNIEALTIAD